MTVLPAPLDWNRWRATYAELTYAEHQGFYSEVYGSHPVQQHFDESLAAQAIRQVQPETVIELGGWNGELAHRMLARHPPIDEWMNVEICNEARVEGETNAFVRNLHHRYLAPDLGDWYWTRQWTADLFVASHTIEHLTADHLERTIAATEARAIYLDAPLTDDATDWLNFTGTHILDLNWGGVDHLLARHGYRLDWSVTHEIPETSGGESTARLYLKGTA